LVLCCLILRAYENMFLTINRGAIVMTLVSLYLPKPSEYDSPTYVSDLPEFDPSTICMSAATGSKERGLDHLVSPTFKYSRFRRSSLGNPNTVELVRCTCLDECTD
jgi:hypothetical protein